MRVTLWTAVTMTAIELFQLTQVPSGTLRSEYPAVRACGRLLGTEFSFLDLFVYAIRIGCLAVIYHAKSRIAVSAGPAGTLTRFLGLVGGYGIKANVREMYCKLSQIYTGDADRIFLFGFSRGAFTVRALAGLIYCCGLPSGNIASLTSCFGKARRLYVPLRPCETEIAAFRAEYEVRSNCHIHFLGVWDTVKSYGDILPTMLPHLRHNPIVRTVRHALALEERGFWFNATSWGQLDLDACGARRRLKAEDLRHYLSQNIEEVWFRDVTPILGWR